MRVTLERPLFLNTFHFCFMALSWRLTWLILKRAVAQLHTRQRPISSGLQNQVPCTESLHHSFFTRYSSPLTFSKTQARFSMASRAGGAFKFETQSCQCNWRSSIIRFKFFRLTLKKVLSLRSAFRVWRARASARLGFRELRLYV